MSSTPGCIGQVTLLTSRSLLVATLLALILLGSLLLEFPFKSYAAGSSMPPQTPSPKLQSENMYSVQASTPPLPPSHIEITNPKNGSTITNPYPILRATADTHYNHVEVFVDNRTDYQAYSANDGGNGHWSLDMSGLLLPGRNNVTAIATFYHFSIKPSLNNNSTIPGPYIPLNNSKSWAYSKDHFDLVVPTPVISSPAEGDKIQIGGVTRPIITGTVDQHYVYLGLSVKMLTTNTSVNRAVGEYYNDSIPHNGTSYWSVKIPGDSLRPGMHQITVWIPFVNLIGEPIVKIYGKPVFVEFVCSDRNIVMLSNFCSK